MSSRGGSSSGGAGVGVQSIPAASRKMVQSLREIVNYPEPEIYSMLKECNMDPNEAVNRLLAQDPFLEVKSKREKKKETKDTTETRSSTVGSTSNRGSRNVAERSPGRAGLAQFSSLETGGLHGKAAYKKENGTSTYHNSYSSGSGYQRPQALGDSLVIENEVPALSGVDAFSSSHLSAGGQPAWSGVPGQKSMADIVKMGMPHIKTSNTINPSHLNIDHNFVHASPTVLHSKPVDDPDQNDEWLSIEEPQNTGMRSVLETDEDSELNLGQPNVHYDRSNQYIGSQTDEVHEIEDGAYGENITNYVGSESVSVRKTQEDLDNNLYERVVSYHSQNPAFERQEVAEGDVSVSSANAKLQQLSVQEDDFRAMPGENGPSVVIPDHLQVQSADCSHLSFGSFGSGMTPAFSGPFTSRALRSNLEESPAEATDSPPLTQSDSRNPDYCADEPITTRAEGNLVQRTGGNIGSYESPSASQPELLNLENQEGAQQNQYSFPSPTSNYTFENAQLLNNSSHSQANSHLKNLTPFSDVLPLYSNSLPSTLLAAHGQPGRESDISYSPFLLAQSMPTKHANTASSSTGSTISMAEALKTVGLSSHQLSLHTPAGNNIATGTTLPQHLAMHTYSQPTLPLGPFANIVGYPLLPQNYTYMPAGFQQAFAGNNSYHQSLAAVLPQYKNNVSVSSLPQSAAAVASSYGAFGSSTAVPPGNYPINTSAGGTISTNSFEDVLSSQYKDNIHLLSLQQQNESSVMWLHGAGSRTMPAVPASTYYGFQGQNQLQPGVGYRQSQQQPPSQNYGNSLGYPNFYQAGISVEHLHHQQPPLDTRERTLRASQSQQPKQSQQQLWQNSY